jgi:hypothetical protein
MTTAAMTSACCRSRSAWRRRRAAGADGPRDHRRVITSTLLTLVVVPVIIRYLDALDRRLRAVPGAHRHLNASPPTKHSPFPFRGSACLPDPLLLPR